MVRKIKRYGWTPDLPDHRDQLYAAPAEVVMKLPPRTDLNPQYLPVYDQGQLRSCTVNAISGAVEFDMIKKKQKRIFVPSRLL